MRDTLGDDDFGGGLSPLIEIRSYTLLPGRSAEFDRLVVEQSVPMLRRRNVDVVAYGPSAQGEDMYYQIRAYPSLEALAESEDAFYGSAEWHQGPREAILALIDTYSSIVLEISEDAVPGMRRCDDGARQTAGNSTTSRFWTVTQSPEINRVVRR